MKTKTPKELFEDGSMLIRDYAGHEQMLMNEGTFIALLNQFKQPPEESEAIRFHQFAENWKRNKQIEDHYKTDAELYTIWKESLKG